MILQVEDLCTTFSSGDRRTTAVDGIGFSVAPGETVGIVGESGSGKSVTALSILRLTDHLPGASIERGHIWYQPREGERLDLTVLPEAELRRIRGREIGMIFQDPLSSLNPVFTCGSQLAEALQNHFGLTAKEARAQALELLHQVELPEPARMAASYPHQLSGGQKQRVLLALALAGRPRLLLADEPTTALDVTVQRRILDSLRRLKEANELSMLFISHDLGVIADIADRVLVMSQGRIVEEGSVEEIFRSAKHPYTQGLLGCRPPVDRRLQRLPLPEDFRKDGPVDPQRLIDGLSMAPEELRERQAALYAQEPLLEVQDLQVWYPVGRDWRGRPKRYVRAVERLSFDLYPGETIGLVGESGSGKSTLGQGLIRLVEARAGQVLFEEGDLLQWPQGKWQARRREFQMIFQNPYASLNPRLPIGEALLEPLRVHGIGGSEEMRRELVLNWLDRIGLEAGHYDRYPHEFSGGQRQRVCIARALIVEPRLLICDECVSALDVSVQAQILNLLRELQAGLGFSCLFISHDMAVTRFMADRLVVLKEGQVVESGMAEEVYANPRNAYTRELLAAVGR